MNDNKPNLENIKKILNRDKEEIHKETKRCLARELKNMAEFKGEYKNFNKFATPLIQEIWLMSACYLDGEF